MLSVVRNQAFAYGMRKTKSAIVGCIKALRFATLAGTPGPLPVSPRNNTTLTPNIKRFFGDHNRTSYNKTASKRFFVFDYKSVLSSKSPSP